jgi:hypothetical protein
MFDRNFRLEVSVSGCQGVKRETSNEIGVGAQTCMVTLFSKQMDELFGFQASFQQVA